MHSTPSGPSLAERITAVLYRGLRPRHGRRLFVRPRLMTVLLGSVVMGLLAAAVPMVSTASEASAPPPVATDGASGARIATTQASRTHRGDVVEMGVDGAPASSAMSSPASTADPVPVVTGTAPDSATLAGAPDQSGSPSPSVTDSTTSSPSTAQTPARGPGRLPQPPVTLPVPPVTTTNPAPSSSPTPTDPSISPSSSASSTADPSPLP